MKKRILSVALCLCMVLSLLPGTASAATSGTCGDNVNWTLESGTLTISGHGPMANFQAGYVTTDSSAYLVANTPWYDDLRSSIRKIVIEDGVTSIGTYAFLDCVNVRQVVIPDTVQTISTYAFGDCESLTNVTIPVGVATISKYTFAGCKSLTSVTIPDSVTYINEGAFDSCKSLTNITISDHITNLGTGAFSNTGLINVTIPESITSIPDYLFARCANLKSVSIPETVTAIDYNAFAGCTQLTEITIPASVTALGNTDGSGDGNYVGQVFRGCSQLTKITVDKDNPVYTSVDGVVFSKSMNKILCYPPGKSGAYSIPSGVTSIGSSAFCYTELSSVTIPGSVTYGLDGAFSGCANLTSVTFLDGATCIGRSMFDRCTNLASITIPDSVSVIEERAFSDCTGLSDLVIPSGVISVGREVFSGCTSLASVIISEGVTSIGDYAFKNCGNLTRLVLPDSLTNLGHQAFWHCTSLISAGPVGGNYNIQMGWKNAIPDNAFQYAAGGAGNEAGLTSLTSVTIPDGVTTIGHYAFSSCSGITSVTIPQSVTSIGGIPFPEECVKDVWYAGSKADWEKISISTLQTVNSEHWLKSATIHYGKTDSEPTVTIQSVTLTRDSVASDLLTQTVEFDPCAEESVDVSVAVDWDGGETGRVFLIQDRNTWVELTSQLADVTPGTTFYPNSERPIYVIATDAAASKILDWKLTGLQIVPTPDAPSISIDPSELNLKISDTTEVLVTTTPADAAYTLVSSAPEVVSVLGNTLTVNKLGRAEITATLVDYPTVQAVCSVTVKGGYDDLMCAIAACQLSYEDELTRYDFGATVETFADAAIGPNRQFWSGYTEAVLSDFYKDVLGDWKILAASSYSSGLFAAALYNEERNLEIIAFRGTEIQHPNDVIADLQFAVLNQLPEQFYDAMDFYNRCAGSSQQILLTGHSLGGAAACYVSLMTGERAELFNGANGLIIEDAYFVGGEGIYQNFHGADRWNFVNHVTDCAPVSVNHPIAYPNADNLPVEVHAFSSTILSGSPNGLDGHSLCSMLEYDRSTGRFWLTQSVPYNQTLSAVQQFEMTRVDGIYFASKILEHVKKPKWLEAVFEIVDIYQELAGEDYLKVRFNFGSSIDDDIIDQNLIEQVFLFGGDGNDFLTGGCINDVLAGGLGVNAMDGGPMNDLYIITGTDNQYINDCSGVDDIYIPNGVRVRSFGNPTDKVDEYYVLTLTNGQQIMINKNRKQDFDNRFRVYSMDGTFCGSYRTVPQEPESRMMTLAAEDKTSEASDKLPITTLEFAGRDLIFELQDNAGNSIGTVNTNSDSFPLYKPYGYFYYDSQEETLWAHLFDCSGEVRISSAYSAAQTVDCVSIFHAASDDMPLKRFTAKIDLQSSDAILTPSCFVQEPAVPFKLMDGDGNTQEVPVKTEDLTASKAPDTPNQSTHHMVTVIGGSGSGSYAVGDTVTITANIPSGQRFTGWTVNVGSVALANTHGTTTTFTMPAQAVTVTANFQNISSGGSSGGGGNDYTPPTYKPDIVQSEHGSVTVTPSSPKVGDKVTIKPTPDAGYAVDQVTVTNQNGKNMSVTENEDGTYTFIQPSGKVKINVTYKAIEPVETEWSNPFTDVAEGVWYFDAVKFVNQNGLMNGIGNGLFAPNSNLSRAMLAEILYNKEGRPTVTAGSTFTDVQPDAWYADAVAWAASRGIVGGYGNGKFGPNDNITREQLAVMLWRYAGKPTAAGSKLNFTDADKTSSWAKEAMLWATEKGIINGKGNGILDPTGKATRAEAAQMLKNYLEH